MPDLIQLSPDMIERLDAFWKESFPRKPMTRPILRQRVFGPPDACPELSPALVDDAGAIVALALVVAPGTGSFDTGDATVAREGDRVGGLRAFGVHPSLRGRGHGQRLMDAACEILRTRGATVVDFLCTPPWYIQPGIDTRETEAIAWLARRRFVHYTTFFNMTVDLTAYEPPSAESVEGPCSAGYRVRRATEADLDAARTYCLREWNEGWTTEALLGLDHEPPSLFLALDADDAIVGFAVYEGNQCAGCFGPTGVTPGHQGHGLGRRLLHATLADIKRLGREFSEIGWIGPVDFYQRAANAKLGPAFWAMRRRL